MLETDYIISLFHKINDALSDRGERGEIGIVGGTVMCLVYNARKATRDVDCVFEPSQTIRKIAKKIAAEEELPEDWLNDGAKGFLEPGFTKQDVLDLSHLRVWAPEPKYMLAMKCISARWDSNDRDDVIFLIKFLSITSTEDVLSIIEHYYPKKAIPAKTQFFIEEIME